MTAPTASPDSYYQRTGERRYKPTAHAGGAWNVGEQHFSPLAGLIVHAIDRHLAAGPAQDLAVARISFDILGRIALDECEITVETVRPGRTVELLEAVVVIGDRPVVRARAWLLASLDTTEVAGTPDERLAPPETFPRWPMTEVWDGGFIASIDIRRQASPRPAAPPPGSPAPSAWSRVSRAARWRPSWPSWTPPTASRSGSRPRSGCTPTWT